MIGEYNYMQVSLRTIRQHFNIKDKSQLLIAKKQLEALGYIVRLNKPYSQTYEQCKDLPTSLEALTAEFDEQFNTYTPSFALVNFRQIISELSEDVANWLDGLRNTTFIMTAKVDELNTVYNELSNIFDILCTIKVNSEESYVINLPWNYHIYGNVSKQRRLSNAVAIAESLVNRSNITFEFIDRLKAVKFPSRYTIK